MGGGAHAAQQQHEGDEELQQRRVAHEDDLGSKQRAHTLMWRPRSKQRARSLSGLGCWVQGLGVVEAKVVGVGADLAAAQQRADARRLEWAQAAVVGPPVVQRTLRLDVVTPAAHSHTDTASTEPRVLWGIRPRLMRGASLGKRVRLCCVRLRAPVVLRRRARDRGARGRPQRGLDAVGPRRLRRPPHPRAVGVATYRALAGQREAVALRSHYNIICLTSNLIMIFLFFRVRQLRM